MNSNTTRIPWMVLALGLIVPTLITWIYFVAMADAAPWLQKTAYGLGKGTQLAVLLVALVWWYRPAPRKVEPTTAQPNSRPTLQKSFQTAATWGFLSGLLIGLFILGVYRYWLLPAGVMAPVQQVAIEKLRGFGADTPALLLALGGFYSLFHSGFEELYWRGFVFRGLLERMPFAPAIAISSIGFMAHHVVVLAKFFGYDSIFTYLCALGVATGGVIWAWLYHRSHSLIPGWVSHALVDAAIFGVGYWMLYG